MRGLALAAADRAIVEQFVLAHHRMWTQGLTAAVAREKAAPGTLARRLRLPGRLVHTGGLPGVRLILIPSVNSEALPGEWPTSCGAIRRNSRSTRRIAKDIGAISTLAPQLAILAEGAQTTAAISGSSEPAEQARGAAEELIDAALSFG